MNKFLDQDGLRKVFEIVDDKIKSNVPEIDLSEIENRIDNFENDVTGILNGVAQELEKKADKSEIPTDIPDFTYITQKLTFLENQIEKFHKPKPNKLYLEGKFRIGSNGSDWYVYNGNSSSSSKVSFSSEVNRETLEFNIALEDVKPPYLFYNNNYIENIDFSLIPIGTTSLSYCFWNCMHVINLNLDNWDTKDVTETSLMFNNCNELSSLSFKNWDLGNIIKMNSMFYNCYKLISVDFSTCKIGNVTDMSDMFYGCKGLEFIDLSSFDTKNVTTIESMFYNCVALTSLIFGNFNLINCTSKLDFSYSTNLTDVKGNLSNIGQNVDLRKCPLTNESAMVFINGLAEVTSYKYIQFSSVTYNTLTKEQKQIATNKGWTVMSA